MQSQYTPACHMTKRKETGRVIQNKICSSWQSSHTVGYDTI